MAANTARDHVRLNVGGRIFETSATTLAAGGPDSFFAALLSDSSRWSLQSDAPGSSSRSIFIDRDPECFEVLLHLLRTGDLRIPDGMSKDSVYKEALYFGLEGHLRAAARGNLNGNLLGLSHSVTIGHPRNQDMESFWTTIRASPTGGFSVWNQGNTVRTFHDWNMEERPPICLDVEERGPVSDIVWCDPRNIVILNTTSMGLFDSRTGRLSHWYPTDIPSLPKSVTFEALCINPNNGEIFSSYEEYYNPGDTSYSTGIVIWDLESGLLKRTFDLGLGVGRKLKWLSAINCLLEMNISGGTLRLCLEDYRAKEPLVWYHDVFLDEEKGWIADATVEEKTSSIWLVDDYMNLGGIDIRRSQKPPEQLAQWIPSSSIGGDPPESIHCHNGQLFAQTKSEVCVFTDGIPTSTIKASDGCGGTILDISISGDRLFGLHRFDTSDPAPADVVCVWETRSPCNEY